MKGISGKLERGKLILNNTYTKLAGIQIEYSGNVYFTPTLPSNWVFRAGKNKVLIFNMGQNPIGLGESIFSFEGELKIRYAFGVTSDLKRFIISILQHNNTWSKGTRHGIEDKNSYLPDVETNTKGSLIKDMNQSWDSMGETRYAMPKPRK